LTPTSGVSLPNAFGKSSPRSRSANPCACSLFGVFVAGAGEQSGKFIPQRAKLSLHQSPVSGVPIGNVNLIQCLGKRVRYFLFCCHKSSPQWCNHSAAGEIEPPRRARPATDDDHLSRVNVTLDFQAFECIAPMFQRGTGEEMSTTGHVPTFQFVNCYHGVSLPNAFGLSSLTGNWRRRCGFIRAGPHNMKIPDSQAAPKFLLHSLRSCPLVTRRCVMRRLRSSTHRAVKTVAPADLSGRPVSGPGFQSSQHDAASASGRKGRRWFAACQCKSQTSNRCDTTQRHRFWC